MAAFTTKYHGGVKLVLKLRKIADAVFTSLLRGGR